VFVEGDCIVDPVTGYTLYRATRLSNLNMFWITDPAQEAKGTIEITEQLIGKPDIPAAAPEKK